MAAYFLSDLHVRQAIQAFATSPNPHAYTGAGLTIDRTGHSWSKLVTELLEWSKIHPETIAQLGALYGPAQLATIAVQKANGKAGTVAEGQRRINKIVDQMLYQTSPWQAGQAATDLAVLADAMKAHDGHLTVMTSNYDSFYEEELLRQNLPAPPYVSVLLDENAGSTYAPGASEPLDLVYLHGSIPADRIGRPSFIVLSERQYFDSADAVDEYLRQAVEHPLLIVGSGLTDEPLLRALARQDPHDPYRVALITNASIEHADRGSLERLQQAIQVRMEQFGVTVLYPNYFGQVAQFMHEISLAVRFQADFGPYDAEDCSYSYTSRLDAWRTRWNATRRGGNAAEAQQTDHEALAGILPSLRQVMLDPNESIKVELWIRSVQPTPSGYLRLWASSSGPWLDSRTMRLARVQQDSEMLAIQSYCSGRAILSNPRPVRERWRAYFTVPVFYEDKFGRLPVGAISVATMKKATTTRLESEQTAVLEDVAKLLRKIAKTIVDPSD